MHSSSDSPVASRALLRALAILACIGLAARPAGARMADPQRGAAQAGAPTTTELAARFRRAHDAQSLDDLRRLVYWGRATEDLRKSFERIASGDFGKAITRAVVEAVAPGEVLEYSQNGIAYKPTLPPTGRLKVAFASAGLVRNETTAYLVGRSNDTYYLLLAEPSR